MGCRFFLLLVAVMHCRFLQCQQYIPEKKEKYYLSVCAIFKNESKYLKEWIEYHRLIGVDHFYLYSNNSTDRPGSVLKPYIQQGIVTLIHWPDRIRERETFVWSLGVQAAVYENAIYWTVQKETRWLTILDVDEFLIPMKGNTLVEILEKYNQYPGIIFSRTYYDARTAGLPKNLVIESTEMIKNPVRDYLPKSVEKMIFKPGQCHGFTWPPYRCCFKEQQKPLVLSQSEVQVNHYSNRNKKKTDKEIPRQVLRIDQRMIQPQQIEELLDAGYKVEDADGAVCRFVPELRKRLGITAQ